MPAPAVITLGCRMNLAESETLRRLVAGQDVTVINSCAVTEAAVRDTRAAIRRAAAERPGMPVVVTGCAAEIAGEQLAAMPEVARLVPNAAKLLPESWNAAPSNNPPVPFAGHARAFVDVQNGCDHRCTFCIIPAGRGPSRSQPAGAVIDRIHGFVEAGHREVVLTGVDLTSYGPDLPGAPTLGSLVERILRHVPRLERLRLSSTDGAEVDERLFALLTQERRVMPHVHLSLQAGDDLILKRMRRRHSRAAAVALVERLKAARPEIAIGADLIAGFPTETEEQAANTLAILDDCDVVHAHVFPYSPRPGTPAARMPQVPVAVAKARAAALRTHAAARRARWLAGLVGTQQSVLVERPSTRGHAPCFAELHWATPLPLGAIATCRVTGFDGARLHATPIGTAAEPVATAA
ncbi:tRNA (N(6)-L-threonylcarbamoyladenosine(37)-C(2))-methylthiotransferase MtaB [Sphingomonas aracearum]|uniref:tRNA (N(6)-L-threonylcarbamoyladenosine(37)-C(2))-methylthiotransferase MtaB n=1 Tax=Sphingomonas aracearum TaxID=2283317 RepID=A0A369VV60_9SPHN|nr:tRNA (N(6)-L-threonylcarbamoyladenosine(37)-C(2))-methylthiotransferase MtaB [Sphingomonas aracearum]RDE06274.1 tRNA (N(6)-L-threonylcarbamoyladenosine(37)-C(2))-methylthiotransferase MtaB [Sphingomonas aracearum]